MGNGERKRLLFLCTGNYYRSRFAEEYFNHLAEEEGIGWDARSKGLCIHPDNGNVGPIATSVLERLHSCSIYPVIRDPEEVSLCDLKEADKIIALDETEHRPMLHQLYPDFEEKVEYWDVADVEFQQPKDALPQIEERSARLVMRLLGRS